MRCMAPFCLPKRANQALCGEAESGIMCMEQCLKPLEMGMHTHFQSLNGFAAPISRMWYIRQIE